ncbi:MAG: glycosyl hydrolase family 28 protein [Ruminococcus flavefaciens]|nr:glycosyl hydrolase family 28 protein [Ruminococcus flavefaciens]
MGIYNVKAFGAVGDGNVKDTDAIQRAIDSCAQAGGGTVLLEDGEYISGTLRLRSNVYLEIAAGTKLLASKDISDYAEDSHHNRYRNEQALDRCLIYAEDSENFGITGYGEINGNSEFFPNENSIYRPMMIRFLRCRNIHLSGIKLYNSAAWTTAFLDSEYIWIDSVDIQNRERYNGDGLDFDGCSHVYVSNCYIFGTDDNFCLQSSNPEYPVHDIHVVGCEFSSVCAAIRIGLKSIGKIYNVVVQNCTMHNVWREGIKIECTEGGSFSDILIDNIAMHNVSRPIFIILNNRFEPNGAGTSVELMEIPEIGTMENITISNIHATDDEEMEHPHLRFNRDVMGSPRFNGIRIDAERLHPIRDLTLRNIHYTSVGGVRLADIPEDYPEVIDRKKDAVVKCSENYYPDWSRAVFMDIRNVEGLWLDNIVLKALRKDERQPVILERCNVLEEHVYIRE